MRLWSLHPSYLDPQGLVAAWREALLAQAVLAGKTRGYQHHPQLHRFRTCATPRRAIAVYLDALHEEASRRGYSFDGSKIGRRGEVEPIRVARGQLAYEWSHLDGKLRRRSPEWRDALGAVSRVKTHPLFRVVPGGIAEWERP